VLFTGTRGLIFARAARSPVRPDRRCSPAARFRRLARGGSSPGRRLRRFLGAATAVPGWLLGPLRLAAYLSSDRQPVLGPERVLYWLSCQPLAPRRRKRRPQSRICTSIAAVSRTCLASPRRSTPARGWISYGASYRSELGSHRINENLTRWAMYKLGRFKGQVRQSDSLLQKLYQHQEWRLTNG
jgi:hypothetical protein